MLFKFLGRFVSENRMSDGHSFEKTCEIDLKKKDNFRMTEYDNPTDF